MDVVDPIASFNAWNLSTVVGPAPGEEFKANDGTVRFKAKILYEQPHIVRAVKQYVHFLRDGVRCFISMTLRKELYVTDGNLFK